MDHNTLLLVGRTGNGKSSLVNSILQKKVTSSGDEISVYTNGDLTLIDGSGIGDTGDDMIVTAKQLIDSISEKMEYGFTALVFVLKYGVRFTQQEKNAVKAVKSIFGEDVFRHWGIIVMTYGDNFELDLEDVPRLSFQDWCRDQTGDVQNLFQECRERCVLFNNKRPDDTQNQTLHTLVQNVKLHSHEYSVDDFNAAKKSRDLWMQHNDKQCSLTISDEYMFPKPATHVLPYTSAISIRDVIIVFILAVPALLLYLWIIYACIIYIVLVSLLTYWKYFDQINEFVLERVGPKKK